MQTSKSQNTEPFQHGALSLSTGHTTLARYLRITVLLVLLWLALAWVLTDRYVQQRADAAIALATQKIDEDISDITTGLERSLFIFHGVPAILSRDAAVHGVLAAPAPDAGLPPLTLAQRRVQWASLPALAALNTSLAASVTDIRALSVIWVMNSAGDCIASSNSATAESFVGINYADRDYFVTAQQGRPGQQFAVGRATGIPGLFFSAPVIVDSKVIGVVGGKIDLTHLASWVNQANAFITDTYGVIIQAQDKRLEMRALPEAAVSQLSAKQKLARYRSETIPTISITPWAEPAGLGLFRLNTDQTPLLMRTRTLAHEGLNVVVMQPVPVLATQAQDRRTLFLIAAALGSTLICLVAAGLHYLGNLQHTRRHREHQRQIEYLASHDTLTGVFSRAVIDQMISQGIAIAARTGRKLGVLFMDLDMFKNINDSMGHEVGDLVLKEVAQRLRAAVRASDPVIRHGGDEFVVLLHDIDSPDDAARLSTTLLKALRAPFVAQGMTLNLSGSMGVAIYPDDGDSASMLLRNADSALYRAKAGGRADFCFYHASMNADTMAHLALENELRQALAENQFVLHYQPQYSLEKKRFIGCEALVRWQHPTRGLLPPGEFIIATEKSGLIVPLGQWVLEEACRQASAWRNEGLIDFPVAVNLSAIQFRKPGLVATVQAALDASQLSPHGLELELTESALMENTDSAMQTLCGLKDMGVALSIDDFGTGYSSLAYIKRFEPNVLKIDRSFVRDVDTDANDLAIVNAIIGLGRNLNYRVIAEGVETERQMIQLQQMGCDEIQGYWFSRPLPADEFAAFVRKAQS
ncbi:MAG: EAL domain-containing protein [Pseudomonadota bacterium]